MSANPLKRYVEPHAQPKGDRAEVGHRVANNYNTRLAYETPDKGIRWIYDERSDQMRLVPLAEYRRITA